MLMFLAIAFTVTVTVIGNLIWFLWRTRNAAPTKQKRKRGLEARPIPVWNKQLVDPDDPKNYRTYADYVNRDKSEAEGDAPDAPNPEPPKPQQTLFGYPIEPDHDFERPQPKELKKPDVPEVSEDDLRAAMYEHIRKSLERSFERSRTHRPAIEKTPVESEPEERYYHPTPESNLLEDYMRDYAARTASDMVTPMPEPPVDTGRMRPSERIGRHFKQPTLYLLQVGRVAYITPQALFVTPGGDLMASGEFWAMEKPDVNYPLPVVRMADGISIHRSAIDPMRHLIRLASEGQLANPHILPVIVKD